MLAQTYLRLIDNWLTLFIQNHLYRIWTALPGAVAGLEPNSGVDEVFGNEAPKDGVLDSCPNPNDAVCTFTMLTVHNCANYDRRNI